MFKIPVQPITNLPGSFSMYYLIFKHIKLGFS